MKWAYFSTCTCSQLGTLLEYLCELKQVPTKHISRTLLKNVDVNIKMHKPKTFISSFPNYQMFCSVIMRIINLLSIGWHLIPSMTTQVCPMEPRLWKEKNKSTISPLTSTNVLSYALPYLYKVKTCTSLNILGFISFYVYEYLACMCVSIPCVHMVFMEVKKKQLTWFPVSIVDGCGPLCGCWNQTWVI